MDNTDTIIEPIQIVHYTRWFNTIMFGGKDKPIEDECFIPDGYQLNLASNGSWCTITSNTNNVDNADAIVFHAPDYEYRDPPKKPGQPWILYSQETPNSSPFRKDEKKMINFDFLASYHRKSQYFFTYYSPAVMDNANRILPTDFMKQKRKKAPILWIARNCNASNGRQYYIEQLMKYINVDSYSSCLNNKDFPDDKTREQLMSEYKFYLAVENSNCEDYATEKLVDTLKYSTVPIIDGPSSYDGFLPNKRAAIRMDAYPDPRDLAKYINFLDENDDAYLAYFQYRNDALTKPPIERLDESFINLWSDQGAHNYRVSWCSICRHLAMTWDSRKNNPIAYNNTLALERNERFIVDTTCMEDEKWKYSIQGPPYDTYTWIPSEKDEFGYDIIKQKQKQLEQQEKGQSSFFSSFDDDGPYNKLGMVVIIGIIGCVIWFIYKRSNRYKLIQKQSV